MKNMAYLHMSGCEDLTLVYNLHFLSRNCEAAHMNYEVTSGG